MKHRRVGLNRVGVLNRDGHTIGLDIGATGIRATVLAPRIIDGRPSVTEHGIGDIDLPRGVVVEGVVSESEALTAALKQLWRVNKFACDHVILGVANQQVVVRPLSVPDLTPQQRAKALPYQAREIVALPIDQVVLDFCQLDEADPETNLVSGLLFAMPRQPVLVAVAAVERAGLKVARVDLSSLGCLRSIANEQPAVEAIIDLGAQLTTIVIHDCGIPKLVRTLARGGQEVTDQLADRMSMSVLDAEKAKCEAGLEGDDPDLTRMLSESLRPLLAEIRTSVQYFRSMNDKAVVERISLTGGGSGLRGITSALQRQTGLPTRVVDPMQHVRNQHVAKHRDGEPTREISAVSVGLAMGTAA